MTDHIAQDRKLVRADHIVDADEMVRAEFEAWAHKSPANLAKDAAGGYQSATVAFAWRAVQAATQRQQDRIAELEAELRRLKSGMAAIRTLLQRDPCAHANTAIQMIDAAIAPQPSSQAEGEPT